MIGMSEDSINNPDDLTSNEQDSVYHIPVMLHEVIEALDIKPDGVYVDCTFGGGGHSREVLKKLGKNGKLFVFDQDSDAIQNIPKDERLVFIQQNFRYITRFLRVNKCLKVDGILADLGVSSHQFDEPERGFSIRFDAALDMRMDTRQTLTAAKILETYSELQLHKLFEKYGEVTNSKTLARLIVEKRNSVSINTISKLKQVIQPIVKGKPNKYFAQVFQALRIEVNDEMGALNEMLQQSVGLLKPNGRIAVITFHSLEDRIVKNFFKSGSTEEVIKDDVYGVSPVNPLAVVTKKPIEAKESELKMNPRSRSAKLRIAKKVD
jgi:16S rRNA (cytosine1402-N4)-methyltransferase